MAARILQKIDQGKFEKLAYNDESRILLLNMINPLFLTDPSDTLIISLLKSDNDLLKNIGLFMISTKVSRNVDELHQIESGMCSNDCEKEVRNKLCTSVDAFISHLDKCDNKTQASLLVNYLLVHKRYPTIVLGYVRHGGDIVLFSGNQRQIGVELCENDKLIVFTNH